MRAIRTATIKSGRPEDNNKRVKLELHRDKQGAFRWYCQNAPGSNEYSDCEISEATVSKACWEACRSWAGSAWDLRAKWLKS